MTTDQLRQLLANTAWAFQPWSMKDRGPEHDFDPVIVEGSNGYRVGVIDGYDDAALIVALRNHASLLLDVVDAAREWIDPAHDDGAIWRLRDALAALDKQP